MFPIVCERVVVNRDAVKPVRQVGDIRVKGPLFLF